MFKAEARRAPSGNWNLEASCSKGHRVFKDQLHRRGLYKCPYCGLDVH